MDIISYSQGKKAKKQVNKLNQHLGRTNEYKHGDQDIKDTYNTVDERITEMEQEAAPGKLNKKISELSANTMINLNKHNLKVDTFLNANKYQHKDMIFDSFDDSSGINTTLSSNVKLLNGTYKVDNVANKGVIVTKTINDPEGINVVAISSSSTEQKTKEIPLSSAQPSLKNVELKNNLYVLKTKDMLKRDMDDIDLTSFNNVLYVSADRGDDTTADGSIEKPYKRIDKAIAAAVSDDCIYIEEGFYELTPMYIDGYASPGIYDMYKKLTITGEGQGTVLSFHGTSVTQSRDAPCFQIMNAGTVCCNFKYEYTPSKGANYSNAIARWCVGEFRNIFVHVKGNTQASYCYNNEYPMNKPVWKNCVFYHDLGTIKWNYSGSPYYENCLYNATPQGTIVNSINKIFDLNDLDNILQEDDIIDNNIGYLNSVNIYEDDGEIILDYELSDSQFSLLNDFKLNVLLKGNSSYSVKVATSNDGMNYSNFDAISNITDLYRFYRFKIELYAGKKDFNNQRLNLDTPKVNDFKILLELKKPIKPLLYISSDGGINWRQAEWDELNEFIPASNHLSIKVELTNEQELYAISYSWA